MFSDKLNEELFCLISRHYSGICL